MTMILWCGKGRASRNPSWRKLIMRNGHLNRIEVRDWTRPSLWQIYWVWHSTLLRNAFPSKDSVHSVASTVVPTVMFYIACWNNIPKPSNTWDSWVYFQDKLSLSTYFRYIIMTITDKYPYKFHYFFKIC